MKAKIASETPFRLSPIIWTVVLAFALGWLLAANGVGLDPLPPCQPAHETTSGHASPVPVTDHSLTEREIYPRTKAPQRTRFHPLDQIA